MRILAVRLLHTTPAHVVRNVHDRREHLADAAAARLAGNRTRDTTDERRVPRRRERDRLRKRRRTLAHQTVQRLVERNDRNAESRLLDEPALDRVDARG